MLIFLLIKEKEIRSSTSFRFNKETSKSAVDRVINESNQANYLRIYLESGEFVRIC